MENRTVRSRQAILSLASSPRPGELELYDLSGDISEQYTRAKEILGRATGFQGQLISWREGVNAPTPKPK